MSFGHYALYSAAFLVPGTAAYTVAAAGLVDEGQRFVCFVVAAVLLVATLVAARALKGRVQGRERSGRTDERHGLLKGCVQGREGEKA